MTHTHAAALIISTMFVGFALGEETLDQIKQKADSSNTHCQAVLGSIYRNGEMGVKKDYIAALKYLVPAEKNHDGLARAEIGAMYEKGQIVNKDKARAERFYVAAIPALQKLAAEGDARSEYWLGQLYSTGSGGLQSNIVTAVEWFKKSANHNYAGGQTAFGQCYLQGIGVAKNKKKGFKWLATAAKQESMDALWKLGQCYETGDGVSKDPQKAFDLYTRGAEQGSSFAQMFLGYAYLHGLTGEKDYEEALRWITKAVEAGLPSGLQLLLAQEQIPILQATIGSNYATKKKEKQAAEFLFKALKSPSTNAIELVKEFLAADELKEYAPNLKSYLTTLENGQPIVQAETTGPSKKNTATIR